MSREILQWAMERLIFIPHTVCYALRIVDKVKRLLRAHKVCQTVHESADLVWFGTLYHAL